MKNALSRFFAALSVVFGFTFSCPALAIPIASVSDLSESGLLTSVSGIDILPGTLVVGIESWSFSGNLHIPFGVGVISGVHNFVLTDRAGVSDIFTITASGCPEGLGIGACGAGPADFLQQINFSFVSDGEGPLAFPTLGSIDCNFVETGALQTCGITGTGGSVILQLQIASDAVEVPEPAGLALFGLALAGLGFARRRAA